jgi:hypothetical protein
MLALAVMDRDRAARLAISLEVFQTRMAVRSRTVFIWLSPFSGFDAVDNTGLQKKNYYSVTSTKVGELNSIFYAEFEFVLSFSLLRKVFK